MITGHFTVALGTLGLLALVGSNPATWTAKLEGKDRSAISGTARVEAPAAPAVTPDPAMPPRDTMPPPAPEPAKPMDNQLRATLSITNAPQNATLSWHVHQGKCGSNGPIVGSSAAYQPVKVDAQGSGTASASVTASLQEKGEYYADVHSSQDQGAQVAACGTLEYQRTRADDL
ncbi:MAG TPA: CHRD domain-containing protein [Gemmatimonadales bacterium]|jgi:hypothetical protein